MEQSTRKMHNEEALGLLALRYFQSHGPATEQDLAWWCGLTLTDVRTGIENAKNNLEHFVFEGKTYWFENSENALNSTPEQEVFLLAGFDEYLMGYKDRSLFLNPARASEVCTKNGIFKSVILVDGKVAGTWQRTVKKDQVEVQFNLFQALNAGHKEALEQELARFGGFLGKTLKY
ncbi:MAG: AlkZ family DNA glycosylase [Saprospiraceae bacterium]|nr:AlkZ family DNA glycosylase [Saprospiraceae bacterium]